MTNFGKVHRGLELVSAVAGRLRLRALDPDTKAALETITQQIRELDGITEVRVNPETGSLLVVFAPSSLEEKQLLAVLNQFGVRQPENPTNSQALTIKKTSKRLLSLLPALGGIVTTRMLGFTGWSAIGAYFVSTEVLHLLLEQLKLGLPQTLESSQTEPQSASIPHREAEKGESPMPDGRLTPTETLSPSSFRAAAPTETLRERAIPPKIFFIESLIKFLEEFA